MGVKIGEFLGICPLISEWRSSCSDEYTLLDHTYQSRYSEEAMSGLSNVFGGIPSQFILNNSKVKKFTLAIASCGTSKELGDILLEEGIIDSIQDFRDLVNRYSDSVLSTHYVGFMPPIRERMARPRFVGTAMDVAQRIVANNSIREVPIAEVRIRNENNNVHYYVGESVSEPDSFEDWGDSEEEYAVEDESLDNESVEYRYDSSFFHTQAKKEREVNEKYKVQIPIHEYIKPNEIILGEDQSVFTKARQEFNRQVSPKIDWIFNRTEREGFNRRHIEMFTLDELTKRIEKRGVNIDGKQVYDWKLGGVDYVLRMELDFFEHENELVPPLAILTVRSIYKPLDKEMAFYLYLWNGTKFDAMYSLISDNREHTLKNMDEDIKYYKTNLYPINTRGWRLHTGNQGDTGWMQDGNSEWEEVAELT